MRARRGKSEARASYIMYLSMITIQLRLAGTTVHYVIKPYAYVCPRSG